MGSKYWVGGGSSANWDAIGPTNWSDTDGGANNAAVPTTFDDVYLKGSADCVINVTTANINRFDMSGYTGTLSGSGALRIYSSGGTSIVILGGTVTWNGTLLFYYGTISFTSNAKTLLGVLYNQGATVNQQDALTINNTFQPETGTWNTGGYALTCIAADIYGAVNITNSIITCTKTSSFAWRVDAGATLTTTGSTILIPGAGAFTGGGKTYNVVTFSGNGTIIVGNNTFNTLNVNTAGLATGLKFTINSIQTVTNFATNGSSGNLAKILSTTAGSHFHLTTPSAQISVDYMSIKDSIADQANTWYAGANSTDVSGNSGWVFTVPPIPSLSATIAAISSLSTPQLAVSRSIAAAISGQSATPVIDLALLRGLSAAISGQSAMTAIDLALLRGLSAAISGQSATPAITLALLRGLSAAISGQSATPAITLAVLREISAAISGQSATPAITLAVLRAISAAITGQSATPAIDLALLRGLSASISGQSATPAITLAVLREISAAISGQSATPVIDLALLRGLSASISGQSATPAITLAVLREITAAIYAGTDLSEIELLFLLGILTDTTITSLTPVRGFESMTPAREIESLTTIRTINQI